MQTIKVTINPHQNRTNRKDMKAKETKVRWYHYLIYPFMVGWLLCLKTYQYLFQQTYAIVLTGYNPKLMRRVWIRTVLYTYAGKVPAKTIEEKTKTELDLDSCVMLFFYRIPKSTAKSFQSPYSITFETP